MTRGRIRRVFNPLHLHHEFEAAPGMLVLGIAGIPLIGLGALFYSSGGRGNAERGKAIVAGSIFFVPGALMSGFGFYLAFKPQR